MSRQGDQPVPNLGSPISPGELRVFALRYPLVPVTLAYVVGILLGWQWSGSLPALFIGAGLILVTGILMQPWRAGLLWPLLVMLGWLNMTHRQAVLSPWDLRVVAKRGSELVKLRGRLVEAPTQRIFVRDDRESWRSHALVEVEAICQHGEWQSASGRAAVTTLGVVGGEFFTDTAVELAGVLREPQGALARGLFDYRQFLRWQGIYFQLQCESAKDWRLVADIRPPTHPPLADRFREWAQRTLGRGLLAEDEELRLLWAMTLGWRTALTDEVAEPFMRSGTMHVFAISGLHIALIAGILVAVLRAAQLPRRACGVVVIPLIWFYTMATGWQPSAIRSTIMMTVIVFGWSLRRPGNLLNSLAVSGLIILVAEPRQLFQASFQLSFFVVLSIALLLPPFENLRQRLLQTDPFLPEELRPRWQRWMDGPVRFVTTSLATSVAAWVGSLPLIAHYFHLFTPASLLANLVVVPLSSLALMCNLGALACGNWLPWFTEAFNHSGWFFMRGMIGFSHWTTTLPGAFWYLRAPTGLELFAYYTLVLLIAAGWLWSPGKRLGAWGLVLLLAVAWLNGLWRARGEVELSVLGHGGGAVFCDVTGGERDLLVDCGSEAAGNFLVKPFLRAQGINRLGNLALTHGDQRHVGGFNVINREFDPSQVWTSPVASRSPSYRTALTKLRAESDRGKAVATGAFVAGWQVLHPADTDKFARADDSALVLRGDFHGVRVLLLSELGLAGQRALLERQPELRADLVVAGMPDQGEPLIDELLAAVRPRLIVLTDADYPVQKRVRPALRARLGRTEVPVFRLAEAGSLTVIFSPRGLVVKAADSSELMHWPRSK